MRKFLDDFFINRNYALFMGGSFVSATGSWFLVVAISWMVWDIGRSEFLLGVANFAQMGPMLVLGMFGGVLADRVDRRALILRTQIVIVISSVLLALAQIVGLSSIPIILGLLLVMGVSQAFTWPAWPPLIADIVGPERLRTAIALNSARFNLTRIIGPSIAGVLLAEAGAFVCLVVAAAGQVALVVTMAMIRTSQQREVVTESWVSAIRDGLSLSWRVRAVREPMLLAAIMGGIVLPYVVFLPAFAENVLKIGAQGFGLLLTAVGLGAIAGAALSGMRVVAQHVRLAQGGLAVLSGLSLSLFAFSTNPLLSGAALFFVGLGSVGYLATANATIQLAVPREVIG
ncbi:MAG: MFS transporter, partial [Chloroflexota bacterium]